MLSSATLYNLLTGKVPIPAPFRKYAQLPQPKQLNSKISDRVNDAIVKGMALEVQERSQTVREFRELLGLENSLPDSKDKLFDKAPLHPNVDYTKLESLLKASQWEQADRETYIVMLQAVERQNPGWMGVQELSNFPCAVLCQIDQLWQVNSDGKFGLSVQQRIWRSISTHRGFEQATFCKFGDYVGWRRNNEWLRYDNFTFSLEAELGHLPSYGYGVQAWHEWQDCCWHLLPRIHHCL